MAEDENEQPQVFLPSKDQQFDPESLVFDESAYVMYHAAQTGSPCLSFDVIPDELGDAREDFPHTMYLIGGTQSENVEDNKLIVMKMSNLTKMRLKDHSDLSDDEGDDSTNESSPEFEFAYLKHDATTNRIRCTKMPNGGPCLAASWSENAFVYIWDLTVPLNAVNDAKAMAVYVRQKEYPKPIYTCKNFRHEGFALDWSELNPGKLLTGDCGGSIKLWVPNQASWKCVQKDFEGHESSVEDIQWSPAEETVFASCSVDKSIKIWDVRSAKCMINIDSAHGIDINVISWNKQEPFIVSGGDDGITKVWDLRALSNSSENKPFGFFKHHTGPITSLEWHPTDSSVFAAAGSDDQVSIWDLAVEKMGNDENDVELSQIPPQLMFIHMGQKDIKELHWHPQIPGTLISTSLNGFNIFKTICI